MYNYYNRYCTWMENLLHMSHAKVTNDGVVVGTPAVSGANENQEGFSPNCEYDISHGFAPLRKIIYVSSCSSMTEMG